MTIAILTINQPSLTAAERLLAVLDEHTVTVYGKAGLEHAIDDLHIYDKLDDILPDAWQTYDAIIAILAMGAVVRKIAPLLQDKATDPAVLVMNLALDRVVPLLSGHLGGANALAETIASRLPGCLNFLSTATDQTGTLAFEMLAKERGWAIENLPALARISNRLINRQPVRVATLPGIFESIENRANLVRVDWDAVESSEMFPVSLDSSGSRERKRPFQGLGAPLSPSSETSIDGDSADLNILNTVVIAPHLHTQSLTLRPPVYLGIGCNRGTSEEELAEAFEMFLKRHGLKREQIAALGSFEAKRDEAGLLAFARAQGLSITFYDPEAINGLEAAFSPSASTRFFGIKGVAEPSAVLASTYHELLFPKEVYLNKITLAGAL